MLRIHINPRNILRNLVKSSMLHCSRNILRCKGKIINPVSLCPCSPSSIHTQHFVSSIIFRLNLRETLRPGTNHYRYTNYITSIPVRVSSIRPLFVILSKSVDFCRSFATESSPNKEQVNEEALDEILLAIKNDPTSSSKICISYIDKLCKAGNLSTAARLLQSLRNNHIFFSPNAYSLLLEAAGERSDIDLAAQTFKDLIVSGESLSSTSYLNLAKAFMKTDDSVLLIKFVKETLELNFPRGAIVINRVIYAFAKCRQVDKALLIFYHMKSLKCKPDQITYNTVLEILGQAGRVDEMIQEFVSMKEANIAPDIISYNTLINSLRKVGRLDLCLVYLKEMVEIGLEPDLRTYTALIESFGRSGNIEESLRLFGEMKQRHVRPSIYIYRSLINNLKKIGKLELAMTFSKEMNLCFSDLVGPKDFKKKK